jgi:predicted peroxiredoxin
MPRRLGPSLLPRLVATLALALLVSASAYAQDKQRLFINLSSDTPWRTEMALTFAGAVLERGVAVTLWLNNEGVRVAKAQSSGRLKTANQALTALINKGVRVIVCPECLREFGVNERQLVPGAMLGKPEMVIPLLLDANTQVLSW